MTQLETPKGNYYEDFFLGQVFIHGVPRTISESDASLYLGLTGSRFALHCANPIAKSCGFDKSPIDNLLVFHIAFGKTVNDISLNAVANLGYAEVEFTRSCYAGDTLFVSSEVIGLKENSNGKNGVVYVRSKAFDQNQQLVVSWIRWVMINKRTASAPSTSPIIPEFKSQLSPAQLSLPTNASFSTWEDNWSDNQAKFNDIEVGNSIFHRDGITINDSDHSLATRMYQNNARVHFDQHLMNSSHHGKRLVYGGHIISLCRALSYNGLSNALWVSAINAGTHANPCFAGDTIYCQSEILDKQPIPNRQDVGLVRVRMLGIKNNTPENMDVLYQVENQRVSYHQDLVLDIDFWVLMRK
jgi:2-methylfumaryl-CoA hydratase